MSVSVIAANTCSTFGEGPYWEESSQSLLYVDIQAQDIHRWNSATGEDSKLHLDDTVSFVIPRRTPFSYVIGLGRSIAILDSTTGRTQRMVEVDPDTKNRFNDGKCDASGRLWAGTMGYEEAPGQMERKMGSLYSFEKDRSLKKHASKIDISNGLAWTADNSVMFYIDSLPRKVYAFDYDIDKGTVGNIRTAINFGDESTLRTHGYPDGCCIDNDDKLWVACYEAGKVIRFDPETGKELQTVHIPAKRTTSCCFGGQNYCELFVTSGRKWTTEEELETFPLSGSVFRVIGLGAKGRPAPSFGG